MVEIEGICDERFTRVRDAFAANFAAGEEIGATFALAMNGRLIVDLRAGSADRAGRIPYSAETLTPIFCWPRRCCPTSGWGWIPACTASAT